MTALETSSGRKSIHACLCTPDQFKSYDDLKKRMDYVLGTKSVQLLRKRLSMTIMHQEVEEKKVSEEEVLKKLEDSISHPRLQNHLRQLMTMMIPCLTSLSYRCS